MGFLAWTGGRETAWVRCGWFAAFRENQPVIENHRRSAFFAYVESKIAEKGKLHVGKAVVTLIYEPFHTEWWGDKCGFLSSDIAPPDRL